MQNFGALGGFSFARCCFDPIVSFSQHPGLAPKRESDSRTDQRLTHPRMLALMGWWAQSPPASVVGVRAVEPGGIEPPLPRQAFLSSSA